MTNRNRARYTFADSKGRVTLGANFENRFVIVDYHSDGEVIIRLARVLPERESWLYENPRALASVRRGLNQARKGSFAKNSPGLKKAVKLAARLEG